MNIADLGDDYEIEEVPQADFSEQIEEDPSSIESFLRGAAQGSTFGFSDEITGAGEAAGKAAFGEDKLEDLLSNYKKYRDESREAYEKAEEANPAAYMTGDIGAGIGTGLVTGGAGLIGNLGKTGLKQGAKELVKLGAKEGAAFGLGQSKADLTEGEISDALKDTAIGSGTGAILAPTVTGLAKGAGKLGSDIADVVKGSKLGENFSDAYDLAQRGIKFLGKGEKDALADESRDTAEKLIKEFESQYKTGSKKIGDALTSDSKSKDVSENIKKIEKMITENPMPSDDLARLQDILNQYKQQIQLPNRPIKTGSIQGKDIKGIDTAKASMNDMMAKTRAEAEALGQDINFTDPEVIPEANIIQSLQTSRNAAGEITPKVRQVEIPADEFEAAQTLIDYTPGGILENYKDLNLQELQLFKKQMQDLSMSNKMDNYAKSQAGKAAKEIDTLIKEKMSIEAKDLYTSGNQSMSKVHQASDFMKEVGTDGFDSSKASIDLADKMTKPNTKRNAYLDEVSQLLDEPNPELFQQIKDVGIKSRLQKSVEGNPIFGILPSPQAMATYTGNITGNASTKDIVKIPAEMTRRLLNASDESIANFANKMANSGDEVQATIGKQLTDALNNSDKKDRLLWSLSRQPAFRQILEEQGLDMLGLERDSEMNQEVSPIIEQPQEQIDTDTIRKQLLERYRNR